jgi:hypothetical protein
VPDCLEPLPMAAAPGGGRRNSGHVRRQYRVGLAARLAAGIGLVFMLAIVFAPAFGGREYEPVAHARYLATPTLFHLRAAFASTETFDNAPHARERRFRTPRRTIQSAPFGTGAQVLPEIAQLGIPAQCHFHGNVAIGLVVDRAQRSVDRIGTLADGLAFALEWDGKPAISRIVFWFSSALKRTPKSGSSSLCSTCSMLWISADASMFTSTSGIEGPLRT